MLLLFLAALAVSFLMSGMEAGVFALSRLRIRQLMRAGHERAATLYGYLEKPENFLWTILVGNIAASVTVTAIGVLALHEWLGSRPGWFGAALVAGVLIFYAVCELWPKTLFRTYPNRLCMALVDGFRIIHWTLRPLVWLTERFAAMLLRWGGGARFTGHLFGNRDELRFVIQESGQGLTREERAMINRVLDLQTLTVGQIMVPMERAVTVSAGTPVPRLLELARERGLNRLPVWSESTPRRIAGLVSVRSILYDGALDATRTAGSVLRPAQFLSHDLRLEVALRQMQRAGQRLAVVLGPDQVEVGLLSLEDILRVIFGEVRL